MGLTAYSRRKIHDQGHGSHYLFDEGLTIIEPKKTVSYPNVMTEICRPEQLALAI